MSDHIYTRAELNALDTAELRHIAERDFDLDWSGRRDAIKDILYIQEREEDDG